MLGVGAGVGVGTGFGVAVGAVLGVGALVGTGVGSLGWLVGSMVGDGAGTSVGAGAIVPVPSTAVAVFGTVASRVPAKTATDAAAAMKGRREERWW
ncbi:hypothetical protein DEJ12_09250 [Curtobacterium sp. MCLR17_059]|nr:hypothetical protein DEJ12_09250 [Curtobacterium sp. MCLR17_059]